MEKQEVLRHGTLRAIAETPLLDDAILRFQHGRRTDRVVSGRARVLHLLAEIGGTPQKCIGGHFIYTVDDSGRLVSIDPAERR
jgi:hypothetical protein